MPCVTYLRQNLTDGKPEPPLTQLVEPLDASSEAIAANC